MTQKSIFLSMNNVIRIRASRNHEMAYWETYSANNHISIQKPR